MTEGEWREIAHPRPRPGNLKSAYGIVWNLFTWLLGLPSSSSHALFGGLTRPAESGVTGPKAQLLGTVLGWVLFAIVLAGIVLGITFIVASGFGKALSFEHICPTIVDK